MDFTPPLSPRARFNSHRNSMELPRGETPLQSPRRSFAVLRQQARGVPTRAHVFSDLDRAKDLPLEAAKKVERALASRLKNHLDLAIECLPRARNVDDFACLVFLEQNPEDRLHTIQQLAQAFPYEVEQISSTKEQKFFRVGLEVIRKVEALKGAESLTPFSTIVRNFSNMIEEESELRGPMIETLQASIALKLTEDLLLAKEYHDSCEFEENARAFSRHFVNQQTEDDQVFCLVQLAKIELEKASGGNTHFRGESFFTRALGEYFSSNINFASVHEGLLEVVTRVEDEREFVERCLHEILQLKLPVKVTELLAEIHALFPETHEYDGVIAGLIMLRFINRKVFLIRQKIEDPTIQSHMSQLMKVLQKAASFGTFPEDYRSFNPAYEAFQSQFLPSKACS